ncbi:MAG TPA: rhamnogalacturonan acetylesterase [Puia sp.]
MTTVKAVLLGLFCLSLFLQPKKIKIYMIGDSTMANKTAKVYPETGWGQVLHEYFNDDVVISNHAQNGKSTKSFITENRWQRVADSLQEGDYVFIQFGHNDEKVDKPGIGATPEEYRANLVRFITEARAKKAIPILLTPIMRRSFYKGEFHDTHGLYPDVVRNLAAEYKVPLIDMHRKSEALLKTYGDEPSKQLFNWADSGAYAGFPAGVKDNTHFNLAGAHKMAELAVEGIRDLQLPLTAWLKK